MFLRSEWRVVIGVRLVGCWCIRMIGVMKELGEDKDEVCGW